MDIDIYKYITILFVLNKCLGNMKNLNALPIHLRLHLPIVEFDFISWFIHFNTCCLLLLLLLVLFADNREKNCTQIHVCMWNSLFSRCGNAFFDYSKTYTIHWLRQKKRRKNQSKLRTWIELKMNDVNSRKQMNIRYKRRRREKKIHTMTQKIKDLMHNIFLLLVCRIFF